MITAQLLVERSLAAFGDQIAFTDAMRSVSYNRLRERTARLANALVGLGASSERAVATYLDNDGYFLEVDLACTRAGLLRVGIGTRLSADECAYILAHSDAAVLVTSRHLLEKLAPDHLNRLATILLVNPDESGDARTMSYEATLSRASNCLTTPLVGEGHPNYILYTSGTTGRPKGATHTHGARAAALLNMLACEMQVDARSVMVHAGPLTHGSGSKLLTFLVSGARSLILPRFTPDAFAAAVAKHGGTHTFMVPTMLQMLLEFAPTQRDTVRTMRQISFGGSPITNALFERCVEGFGPILTQVYGSCEAPHPITVLRPDDYKLLAQPGPLAETAGRASMATQLRIVDDEGRPLPLECEGELQIKGDHLMRGYWRDPAATADVFDPEGWYASGDVATIDKEGFVRFRDRKRDLIISGGLNVYPSEVERVVAEHPGVAEVAVVGYPDDRWGEGVMACVVRRPNVALEEADLINWVGERLAGYKKPRRVTFLNELPKGSTNKVLKRELKARFWQGRTRAIN